MKNPLHTDCKQQINTTINQAAAVFVLDLIRHLTFASLIQPDEVSIAGLLNIRIENALLSCCEPSCSRTIFMFSWY